MDSIINYKGSPTAVAFHESKAFIRGMMGPFGSGKSVACCWEIFMKAKAQEPCVDGKRRSRWIVARNTQPQLETTTIKTWLDWFPEHLFGRMSRKPPFTHKIEIDDLEVEVIFLALDKPEDQKKLLSFEVTGIWFNEVREIEYDLLAAATGRVGRYPSQKDRPDHISVDKWPTWHGIIMDTNPPTDDHWYYKAAEEQAWAVDKFGNPQDVDEIPLKQQWHFFKQPSGLSKEAENIKNLPGGYDYYNQQLGGKTQEWINVYVHGNYGFIKAGLPVYKTSWNSDIHTAPEVITFPAGGIIYVGIDASGRHPAAIFLYRTMTGQIQALHEVCVTGEEGMGAVSFSALLKQEMAIKFPNHDFVVFGDPAGAWGQNTDERTYFDILRANGIFVKPSPGLRIPERVESVIAVLERNQSGQPAMIVSPACKVLLRGFNGGYRYRKLNTSGGGHYDDKPDKKNGPYADIHDALQYVLCGMGETSKMYGRTRKNKPTVFAKAEYHTGG